MSEKRFSLYQTNGIWGIQDNQLENKNCIACYVGAELIIEKMNNLQSELDKANEKSRKLIKELAIDDLKIKDLESKLAVGQLALQMASKRLYDFYDKDINKLPYEIAENYYKKAEKKLGEKSKWVI